MSAHAVRTWLRNRTRRLYENTSHTAMAMRMSSAMVTAGSPQKKSGLAELFFAPLRPCESSFFSFFSSRQHFTQQLQRIEAQRAGQLREFDHIDAALAAFDLRHV